jgi:hypothetical protein
LHRKPDRPAVLSTEEREDLLQYITESYAHGRPCTTSDVIRCIGEQYRKTMDANSVRHMLDRESRRKSCQGVSVEENWLQVTEEEMAMYFERLSEAIDWVPAHFLDHMDEMGHQEWAGHQEKVWYVPSAHGESHVYFPVP